VLHPIETGAPVLSDADMSAIQRFAARVRERREGADAIEYALLAGFFSLALSGYFLTISESLRKLFLQVTEILGLPIHLSG